MSRGAWADITEVLRYWQTGGRIGGTGDRLGTAWNTVRRQVSEA